jgi:hypothetical protein
VASTRGPYPPSSATPDAMHRRIDGRLGSSSVARVPRRIGTVITQRVTATCQQPRTACSTTGHDGVEGRVTRSVRDGSVRQHNGLLVHTSSRRNEVTPPLPGNDRPASQRGGSRLFTPVTAHTGPTQRDCRRPVTETVAHRVDSASRSVCPDLGEFSHRCLSTCSQHVTVIGCLASCPRFRTTTR